MNCSFVCKLYDDYDFLGTAFFIRENILYTANHNFKNVEDKSKCYIKLKNQNGTKYKFKISNTINELDLAELILENTPYISLIPSISTECITEIEKSIFGYGYKEDDNTGDIIDVNLKLEKYDVVTDEISDNIFMIKDEEDGARWDGISGSPIYTNDNVCGMVVKNIGGDGLKTRIKVISFNKILNYLVENNLIEMVENFPQTFLSSYLYERISNNKELCDKLYYNSCFEYDNRNIDFKIDFLKLEDNNKLNLENYLESIHASIGEYALTLDDRCKMPGEMTSIKYIMEMSQKIAAVEERMKYDFNSTRVILWMLSEGMLYSPKIGKILIDQNGCYEEKEIYFKRSGDRMKILIPFISVYEDINKCLYNIFNSIKNQKNRLDISEITWDAKALECLDYISQVNIGNIIRGKYTEKIDIDVTALIVYTSELYDSIPDIINSEDRRIKYFNNEFEKKFKGDIEEYDNMVQLSQNIGQVNVHLFVVPITDVNVIEKI